uniref:Dentin sialophosphoprotein-like n=1 Tax=Heterorhabditis bacteriophora TaxID=37862 RepID=A0A1I7XGD6_HETBA
MHAFISDSNPRLPPIANKIILAKPQLALHSSVNARLPPAHKPSQTRGRPITKKPTTTSRTTVTTSKTVSGMLPTIAGTTLLGTGVIASVTHNNDDDDKSAKPSDEQINHQESTHSEQLLYSEGEMSSKAVPTESSETSVIVGTIPSADKDEAQTSTDHSNEFDQQSTIHSDEVTVSHLANSSTLPKASFNENIVVNSSMGQESDESEPEYAAEDIEDDDHHINKRSVQLEHNQDNRSEEVNEEYPIAIQSKSILEHCGERESHHEHIVDTDIVKENKHNSFIIDQEEQIPGPVVLESDAVNPLLKDYELINDSENNIGNEAVEEQEKLARENNQRSSLNEDHKASTTDLTEITSLQKHTSFDNNPDSIQIENRDSVQESELTYNQQKCVDSHEDNELIQKKDSEQNLSDTTILNNENSAAENIISSRDRDVEHEETEKTTETSAAPTSSPEYKNEEQEKNIFISQDHISHDAHDSELHKPQIEIHDSEEHLNDTEEPSDSGLQQYLPHEEQGNVETEIRGSDSEYQQHEEHEHVTNDAEEPSDSGLHHDFSTHHFSKGTMGENATEITPLEQDLLHLSSVEDDKISTDSMIIHDDNNSRSQEEHPLNDFIDDPHNVDLQHEANEREDVVQHLIQPQDKEQLGESEFRDKIISESYNSMQDYNPQDLQREFEAQAHEVSSSITNRMENELDEDVEQETDSQEDEQECEADDESSVPVKDINVAEWNENRSHLHDKSPDRSYKDGENFYSHIETTTRLGHPGAQMSFQNESDEANNNEDEKTTKNNKEDEMTKLVRTIQYMYVYIEHDIISIYILRSVHNGNFGSNGQQLSSGIFQLENDKDEENISTI